MATTIIRRLKSTRQLIMSRWECCLVGREHIGRKALIAELAAWMMTFFYFVMMALFAVCFSIISFLRFFDLIYFDTASADVVLWGFCLYLMIALGLFSYAGLMMLVKDCRFTASRVSFFVSICALSILFYNAYVAAPDAFYDYYGADSVLSGLTGLGILRLYRFGDETSVYRFVSGEISASEEAEREAKAKARTVGYYTAVDLVCVVLIGLPLFRFIW